MGAYDGEACRLVHALRLLRILCEDGAAEQDNVLKAPHRPHRHENRFGVVWYVILRYIIVLCSMIHGSIDIRVPTSWFLLPKTGGRIPETRDSTDPYIYIYITYHRPYLFCYYIVWTIPYIT